MYGRNRRNSGIRWMLNYAAAVDWHDKIEPIRGKGVNAGLRPLGHRNRMQFQIRKTPEGDVVCQCWKTDVVTFHPDNTVSIKTGGWDSQTTAHFINDVLNIGAVVADRDVQVVVGGGYYRVKTGIKLRRRDGVREYEVVEHVPHETHSINRKMMGELRKKVKGFRTYLSGVIKLRGDTWFDRDELDAALEGIGQTARGNWDVAVYQWRQDVKDISMRQHAMLAALMEDDKDGSWYRCALMLIFNGNGWAGRVRANYQYVMQHLDDLLIATHPEVLQAVRVEDGKYSRDRYKKFLPYKELANV